MNGPASDDPRDVADWLNVEEAKADRDDARFNAAMDALHG